jgi:hypothetical protein
VQQWQYKQIPLNGRNDELVAAAGKEGWEAFAVATPRPVGWASWDSYPIMYFKRPLATTQDKAEPEVIVSETARL